MNHLIHIMILIGPIMIMSNVESPTYRQHNNTFVPKMLTVPEQKPKEFLPKSECNFNDSSNLVSKKVKYFAYDCLERNNDWLLINFTEANYIDVLRK